ncbi:hypothetical protein LJC58_03915 [Lachnospiraceae bacterium OttesenSCG-928-D06]|nr:hypothetical protein [Lachnospiraceae bacterium OttesenSCG-928-D06]
MIELSNYKDVDSTISTIINKFYELMDSGNINDAYALLKNNETTLSQYHVNANSFNKIELAIYELALKQFYEQRIVISDIEPDVNKYQMSEGSEWLLPY